MKKLAKTVFSLALALCLVLSMGGAAFADWDIAVGSITVSATESGQTVSQDNGQQNVADSNPIITGSSNTNTVSINAEAGATANVTIDDLKIDLDYVDSDAAPIKVTGDGNVNIELDGDNSLSIELSENGRAGLEKNDADSKGTLTITDKDDNGSLVAKNIHGLGAGIGGSNNNSTSNITIEGGTINASGARSSAAIGGGNGGNAEGIHITGGTINAGGGVGGAGIGAGGGDTEYARDIVISGDANVTASSHYGAGIGGGSGTKDVSGIEISGDATVNAKSSGGAAIGTGSATGNVGTIVISDNAQVKAETEDMYPFDGDVGAPIGKGGANRNTGVKVTPDTSKLTSKGSVTTDIRKMTQGQISSVEMTTLVGSYVPSAASSTAVDFLTPSYYVVEGKDAEWIKGCGEELRILLNSDKVEKVYIDGVEVEFEINSDGEVVISADVLEALDNGEHEIEFVFADGSCKMTFTVK